MRYIYFILVLFIFSCKEDMQRELRTLAYPIADSMYSAQLHSINQEADSMCNSFRDRKLQSVIDSILEVRRAQIQQLRSLE